MNTLACRKNPKTPKVLLILNGSRLSSSNYYILSKLNNDPDSILEENITTIDNDPKCHPDIIFDLRCSTNENLAQTLGVFDIILSENTPLNICTNKCFMLNIASLMKEGGIFAICVQRQPMQYNYPMVLRNYYKEMRIHNELGKHILANNPVFGAFTKKTTILIFSKRVDQKH